MKNQPLVSVLMTVYNREKYIKEAIESVINSSYQNWELIIVDDQSKDKSVEIAKGYEKQDHRIKVYINNKNLGDYPNRNKAASYAQGKYLKYLDADDLIYAYGLEVMVMAMEKHPKAALALSHSITDDILPYPYEVSSQEAYQEHFLGSGLFNYGPSALIFRRDIFIKENGFTGEQLIGDTEILLRIGSKYPVIKMPPALVWWRQHEGQEIKREDALAFYLVKSFELNLSMLKSSNCPLKSKDKLKAIERQKQHHARKLLALLFKQKQVKLAFTTWRKSGLSILELLKGFKSYE